MHPTSILQEIQQLYSVSDRLDLLADQHPLVSEALIAISGSVRNAATVLELLVATKMVPLSGLDPANAGFAHRATAAGAISMVAAEGDLCPAKTCGPQKPLRVEICMTPGADSGFFLR